MNTILFEQICQLACSDKYQSACTRKNCAIAALWFAARFCTEKDRKTAIILPTGGVLIYNLERFSLYYMYLTNTDKKNESKSNYSYAARQNLDNHFVHMSMGIDPSVLYFFNPFFLPQYDSPTTFITRDIINEMVRPWTRKLDRTTKDDYQQIWASNCYVFNLLKEH